MFWASIVSSKIIGYFKDDYDKRKELSMSSHSAMLTIAQLAKNSVKDSRLME